MQEKEGHRVFFAITVEKWKQNGDIEEREKKRAASHFICFSCLFQ